MAASTALGQRCATETYLEQNIFMRGKGTAGTADAKSGRDTAANEIIEIPVVVHVLYNNTSKKILSSWFLSKKKDR